MTKLKKEKKEPFRVEIYTDGSFRRPNAAAYAAIILNEKRKVIQTVSGELWNHTINQAELLAVYHGIKAAEKLTKKPLHIRVHSDSMYTVNSIMWWLPGWVTNNFKNILGEPIKNKDIMLKLWELKKKHKLHVFHVKGHSGDVFNEKVDGIVTKITLRMLSKKHKKK